MTLQPLAMPITADPWGEAKDLETLHAKATQAILKAVDDLKACAGGAGGGRPMPLVVLGTAGIGKTHLFSRLRRKLGKGAILVHIRPIMSSEMAPRYVLGEILQQLGRTNGGARQIDSLVGATLAVHLDGAAEQAKEGGLDLLQDLDSQGRTENLDHLCSRLLERMPDLDDGYLEPLLNAPFLDIRALNATLAWLGGKDISESQAHRIGIHQPLAEDRVLPALRTIARLAAPSAPLVVVFDQLENLIQSEGTGRIQAYGNLIMELVDQVRDLVIVQMALDTEWSRGIQPVLSLAQKARVVGSIHVLEMPSLRQAEDLVRLWMTGDHDPTPPFPWPFKGGELQDLADKGVTPRMLQQTLYQRLDGTVPAADEELESGDDLLALAWEDGLQKARAEIDDQDKQEQGVGSEALADGLMRLVRLMPGFQVIEARGVNHLQIGTPLGDVRVALVQQNSPRALASTLGHLASAPGRKLGLREHWRPFKDSWVVTRNHWETLVRQAWGGWHWLGRKDVEQLLALDSLLKAATSRDLSGPGGVPFEPVQVEEWIARTQALSEWEISRALVGGGAQPPEGSPVDDGAGREPSPTGVPYRSAAMPPVALQILRKLRVVSVDRLLRECRQGGEGPSRREVLEELGNASAELVWIGENIVCMKD